MNKPYLICVKEQRQAGVLRLEARRVKEHFVNLDIRNTHISNRPIWTYTPNSFNYDWKVKTIPSSYPNAYSLPKGYSTYSSNSTNYSYKVLKDPYEYTQNDFDMVYHTPLAQENIAEPSEDYLKYVKQEEKVIKSITDKVKDKWSKFNSS